MRTLVTLCIAVFGAGSALNAALGNGVRSGASANTEVAGTVAAADLTFPPLPKLRLAEVRARDGAGPLDSEAVSARAREWARQGEGAVDPLVRARYLLAAANLVLSYEPAGALTHTVLELPREGAGLPVKHDEDSARRAITDASKWIDGARSVLADSHFAGDRAEGNGGVPEESDGKATAKEADRELADYHRLNQIAGTLGAFARAFEAYMVAPGDPDAYRQSREAATALAPILEDSDASVSAAARFWQSALRSREDDPTPALLRLELVNAVPERQTQPYAFFSRLMRCRLIAEHGNTAGALALLLQLEERCHDWFMDGDRRDEALRTVGLIRLNLLQEWYRKSEGDGREDGSAWCADRARKVIEEHFDQDESTIMPLAPTIPILIDAPSVAAPAESATPPSD